jgi:DNA-binding winged helix-turn-helix (wHTH) protein
MAAEGGCTPCYEIDRLTERSSFCRSRAEHALGLVYVGNGNVSVAFGEFVFDPDRRELRRNGSVLKIDPLQLDLLTFFIANRGKLLSKQELLDGVWEGRAVADNVLSVTVAKLRKALGHKPGEREYIENRYGRGYRFLPQVTALEHAPAVSRRPPTPAPDTHTPLVGRIDSLERLGAAWNRARTGAGSIVTLIGEPGIGKTRLAEAFEQHARAAGTHTAWGRYQPGSPPLWPFVQVLRELNESGLAEEILRLLNDRPAERGNARGVDAELSPELALTTDSGRAPHHRRHRAGAVSHQPQSTAGDLARRRAVGRCHVAALARLPGGRCIALAAVDRFHAAQH